MITIEQLNPRIRNRERAIQLVNELIENPIPVRSCDPFQVWETHPVISTFLDLDDRAIAAAIDLANQILDNN
jgi:hypothetical protein